MSAEEQLAALSTQMTKLITEHQRMATANAELTAEVQRLGAIVNFGPPGKAAIAGGQVDPSPSIGNVKAPQFHYGKQCCPEPFTGKNKGGFKDYAFRMSNFLAMSTVYYRHVVAVLDWADKEQAPIETSGFTAQATIEGWDATGSDHLDFSSSLWSLLSNKTEGEALTAIPSVQRGNGVEAWRKQASQRVPAVFGHSGNGVHGQDPVPPTGKGRGPRDGHPERFQGARPDVR